MKITNNIIGMKVASILFLIFAVWSITEAKPSSLYHVDELRQVVPALVYRTPRLLDRRYDLRCFGNSNTLTDCPTNSQNLPYTRRIGTEMDKNQPKMKSNEKPRYQTNNAGHRKTEIFKGLLALINKKMNLKLEQPNMKYIKKYLPMLIKKIKTEIVEAKENTSIEANTIDGIFEIEDSPKAKENTSIEPNTKDVLFEKEVSPENLTIKASASKKVGTLENSFENVGLMEYVTKSQNTVDTWHEIDKTLKSSIEKVEATSEFVDNNILKIEENDLNLDHECIFNASFMSALEQFEQKLYTVSFLTTNRKNPLRCIMKSNVGTCEFLENI